MATATLNRPIASRAYEEASSESARRRIVTIIFLLYWLLIFEGALRKWVFPQAWQYLFFVRDPFVLLVYFFALKDRLWPRFSLLLVWGCVLGGLGLALSIAPLLSGAVSGATLLYGWRNYFLYLPLAFIIGTYFSAQDLSRLARQSLLVAIPISIVVGLQFASPPSAAINAGFIEGGLYQPGVFGPIVRTYGTFTSSAGQTPFVASLVALLLTAWILPRSGRPLGLAALAVTTVAVITCLVLSGSRGAFILAGVVLVIALASSFLMRQPELKLRALVIPLAVVSFATVLATTIFSEAWQALMARSVGAYDAENAIYSFGTVGRAFAGFTDFVPLLPSTPFLGYGLGTFGNAVSLEYTALLPSSLSGESDWARNVLELGPVLGLLYIGLRIALVVYLARGAVLATRRSGNPMPLLLVGFCGILLLGGQITGQGSVHGFGWLYAGFCMAANRVFGVRPSRTELKGASAPHE
jgi:hypothetical protein